MSITLALSKESMDGDGKEASCYIPVANLCRLTTGRTNEVRNVAGLVALTLSSNQYPRKPITTFQAPSIDRLHREPRSPNSRYTWDRSVVGTWPRDY